MNTMHFTQLTSVKKENVAPDCTDTSTFYIQWCFGCTISLFKQNACKQLQDRPFIAPKGVSNLLQNKPQVWFKWTEVTSIHFWTLCDTDGDAIMQELEGSHWYSGALCMCWVVDWPTRLNTTFVFSSFWLDWHKARTSKILDNQTKRTKSDGEPTKEYTRPGESWYAEDIFGKWFQGQCEANRSLHNCKFIDLDILI